MMNRIFYKSVLFLIFTMLIVTTIAQTKQAVANKPKSDQSAISQSDTTERFISVGHLKFRDFNKNGNLELYEDYRKPIDQRAQDLLSKMTMEEKLAQLQCPWMGKWKLYPGGKFVGEKASQAYPNGLGSMWRLSDGSSFGKQGTPNSSQVAVLANETQKHFINNTRLGIPVLVMEEALHGI